MDSRTFFIVHHSFAALWNCFAMLSPLEFINTVFQNYALCRSACCLLRQHARFSHRASVLQRNARLLSAFREKFWNILFQDIWRRFIPMNHFRCLFLQADKRSSNALDKNTSFAVSRVKNISFSLMGSAREKLMCRPFRVAVNAI